LEQKSVSDRVWSFFSSVKLAIVIFSLIGLTSIVGTIIEQQAPREKNIQVLTKLVGQDLAPGAYNVLDSLGFMDMYRSWWFLALLMLFGLNLLVCSTDRFPAIWRQVTTPLKPLPRETFNSLGIRSEAVIKGGQEAAKERARKALKAIGFKAQEEADAHGGYQLFAQKAPWSRLGIYISHFSILIILIGAVIGIFFGFKAFVNIPEGVGYSIVFQNRGVSTEAESNERNRLVNMLDMAKGDLNYLAQNLGVPLSQLKTDLRKYGIIPLDFTVKCEDFDVEFYGRSDMPKAYKSLLTVYEGGKPVTSKWIEVNSPLKYKGVTFYQSSYGLLDDLSSGEAVFDIKTPAGASETRRVKPGESFTIPGSNATATFVDFSPALKADEMGRPVTYANLMNNPAVGLEIKSPGGQVSGRWILEREPASWVLEDGTILELKDFWGAQYTGLQARKDPGVRVVYLGCLTLAIGLFVAFFMSHKKLWVRLQPDKGGTRVQVAATASKNKFSFERQIEKLTALLKEENK